MKIVSIHVPVQEEPESDSQQTETESQEGPLQPGTDAQGWVSDSDISARDESPMVPVEIREEETSKDPESRTAIHNILGKSGSGYLSFPKNLKNLMAHGLGSHGVELHSPTDPCTATR